MPGRRRTHQVHIVALLRILLSLLVHSHAHPDLTIYRLALDSLDKLAVVQRLAVLVRLVGRDTEEVACLREENDAC